MHISKCDGCKKEIKRDASWLDLAYIPADFLSRQNVDLCEPCAKPIVALLRKKKLLKPEQSPKKR